MLKAVFVIHYIDHHYAALVELKDDASDREVIEALLKAREKGVWMVPTEPILYISADYDILRRLSIYRDEIPAEARRYVEVYSGSKTVWRELIGEFIPSLLQFAKNLLNPL